MSGTQAVLDSIASGTYSPAEPARYRDLVDSLLWGGDPYLLLADYDDYVQAQARVDALYAQPALWASRALRNVAAMGEFSSDRAVQEYAHRIWQVQAGPGVTAGG